MVRLWSFSHVHPLRVMIRLGNLRVPALVDTGSDYDAMDHDLSLLQEQQRNPAFRGRTGYFDNVSGFAQGMKLKSEFISDWEVTLSGAPIMGGRKDSVRPLMTFTEFKGLGDPVIIGNPTLYIYGGLETVPSCVWLAGV